MSQKQNFKKKKFNRSEEQDEMVKKRIRRDNKPKYRHSRYWLENVEDDDAEGDSLFKDDLEPSDN